MTKNTTQKYIRQYMLNKQQKAFTLVEILITVSIIAILSAIAIANFKFVTIRSFNAKAKSDLRTLLVRIEAGLVENEEPIHCSSTSDCSDKYEIQFSKGTCIMFNGQGYSLHEGGDTTFIMPDTLAGTLESEIEASCSSGTITF